MMKFPTTAASLTLTQCINLIVQKYTSSGDVISVTSEKNGYDFPSVRMDYSENSLIEFLLDYCDATPKFYIFDEMNIEQTLEQLVFYRNYFNPRSRYLFIGTNFSTDQVEIVAFRNIYNAIFIDEISSEILTYFPFKEKKLRKIDNSLQVVGKCRSDNASLENFFPQKMIVDFKKSEIFIVFNNAFIYTECNTCSHNKSGIEIEIFQLLTKHLHIKTNFIPVEKVLKKQFTGTFDIEIGALLMYPHSTCEQSVGYLTENMGFFVPATQRYSKWRLILSVFSIESWCAFILSLVILALIWAFIYLTLQKTNGEGLFLSTKNFIIVFFEGRNKRCRICFWSQECLYFSVIFLSFAMYSFFNTRLTFLLYGIVFGKGIESPKDIAANELLIGSPTPTLESFLRRIPGLETYPEKFYYPCSDLEPCLNFLRHEKNLALFYPVRLIRNLPTEFHISEEGIILMRQLKETYLTLHTVAYFQKGHPLFHLFNKHLRYLIESGIVAKIVEEYNSPLLEESELELTQKLNYQHMLAPLCLLIVGSCSSLIIFLLEVKTRIV
ncbi:hypothetical protein WA026_008621 [Henosepilachna vigintioctopunctata]|uniref:Ionotropic receptor n=1 Tax=Henosepilachna vigintioctopunctata TaxID=420089 RepID=A0AAW1U916_9CUCU